MSVSISGLSCSLRHEPSGAVISTTPPKDNGGEGSSFSPTDLVAAALASCALTTMALQAGREGLQWGAASARIVKEMVGPPRRIGALEVVFTMPGGVPAAQRQRLEEIARTCPVARSLASDVQLPMTFTWP
jgi:uncharacterized OsmC-like protein